MSTQAVPERASAVLQFWFGNEWASAPATHFDQAYLKRWFMGGADVDKVL